MKGIARSGIYIIVYLLIYLSMTGQFLSGLDPKKEITQYVYDSWGIRDGLPQNTVNSITRGPDGYLWAGSWEGLVRFDGVRFTVYNKSNLDVLSSDRINALYTGRDGTLWIGTYEGLNCLDSRGFSLVAGNDVFTHPIEFIREDSGGNLWVGTLGGGLFLIKRVKRGQGRIVDKIINYTVEHGLPHNYIHDACFHSGGDRWLATKDGLALMIDAAGEDAVSFRVYTTRDGLCFNNINTLFEDKQGCVWIGTDHGISCIRGGTGNYRISNPIPEASSLLVRSIHGDKDGNIWFGTFSGLGRYARGRFRFFSEKQGLADDNIISLFNDGEDNLWIGSSGGGLGRLKNGLLTTYTTRQGLSHDVVWAVSPAPDGSLLCCTNAWGISRQDRGTGRFSNYSIDGDSFSESIRAFCYDHRGRLWLGTFGDGLRLLENDRLISITSAHGLGLGAVRVIYEDRDGVVWVGTNGGGLTLLATAPSGETKIVKNYTTRDGLSDDIVISILQDRSGDLWVGTEKGLNRVKYSVDRSLVSFTQYTTRQGLSNNAINVIYEDAGGVLWLGTYGGGLNRFENGKFKNLTVKHGLFDNTIHQLLVDKQGNFWFSSNRGIFRVKKEELDRYFNGSAQSVRCVSYDEKDGMKNRECNGLGSPAGCVGTDGKLWFPSVKGLVSIDPAAVLTGDKPVPVKVEEIIVDDRKYESPHSPVSEKLVLEPGTRRMEIHYTGLSLRNASKIRFKYKLEGYDQDWSAETSERKVSYTGLDPGNYTFYVSTVNREGMWSKNPTSVSLYLVPYFYQTNWFYILVVLVVLTLGSTGYRVQVNRLKRRAEEHRALREKAENASLAKTRFLTNMSHEIRTPLNAILGFAELLDDRVTDEQLKKYLRSISGSGRDLLNLINDILDLSRIDSGKLELQFEPVEPEILLSDIKNIFSTRAAEKGLDLRVDIDPGVPGALLLDSTRIRQVLFNLVGNAVKFTEEGFAEITLQCIGETSGDKRVDVLFSVRDSGPGIRKEHQETIFAAFESEQRRSVYGGSGLGLAITRRLVHMMGGDISVQSEINRGSTFTVTLKNIRVADAPVKIHAPAPVEMPSPPIDPGSIRFGKATLLIVDDEEMSRGLLEQVLDSLGIRVYEAGNGREAVQLARRHRPDLILMDVRMPVMDGFEACRIIKDDDNLKNIPIIFTTGFTGQERLDQIKQAGGDGYITKPFGKLDLMGHLIGYLPHSRLETRGEQEKAVSANPEPSSPVSILSPDPEKLTALVAALEADFMPRWETIGKTYLLEEIESFSKQIRQLGIQYKFKKLEDWGERLSAYVRDFDMEKVTRAMQSFPPLVKEIQQLISETLNKGEEKGGES